MSDSEIFARIAYDLENLPYAPDREVTIGMTRELFARTAPLEMLQPPTSHYVTLFGCRVELLPVSGLWWIVGYKGTAEEGMDG